MDQQASFREERKTWLKNPTLLRRKLRSLGPWMNAEGVPFESSKRRNKVCFGGFRPLKHVKKRRALARGAPLPMLFPEHPVNDPGENETG